MSGSKNLDKWLPKDLAINEPMTIEINPDILKQFEEYEKESQNKISAQQTEIQRLRIIIAEKDRTLKSIQALIYFKNRLSLYCPQINTNMTILQCATRMKKGDCKGCLDRDAILEELGAKPR